jgi:sugar fermentation stimulation protein A
VIELPQPLLEGRLVRRYKRFLADIELDDGGVVTAHCANPGSMSTCALPGGRVWVSESDNPKRKLRFSWELARVGGQMVIINTARGNQLVADALARRRIPELAGDGAVKREVRVGERSRIDFMLGDGERRTYVEVKSVTLDVGDRVAAFPDSVTTRGARHLEELIALREQGHRAVLLFCVCRSSVTEVRPADEIDPTYGETLRRAAANGVEVLAYGCSVGPRQIGIRRRLPVDLA